MQRQGKIQVKKGIEVADSGQLKNNAKLSITYLLLVVPYALAMSLTKIA